MEAPGLVDSPPISIIEAPCSIISTERLMPSWTSECRDPLKKESGVVFTTPINAGMRLAPRNPRPPKSTLTSAGNDVGFMM